MKPIRKQISQSLTWLLPILIHSIPQIDRPDLEPVSAHLLPQLDDGSSVLPSVLLGAIGEKARDLLSSAPSSSVGDGWSDEEFGDLGREESEDAGEITGVLSEG